MERKVPSATSEEIQLYRTTIYSLLRSSSEVKIRTMEEVHAGMNSLMHAGARDLAPDIGAFVYAAMRLPMCISDTRMIVLGQNENVFRRNGFQNVDGWLPVSAKARRRRCFFDSKDTLACFIASRSDIEDVIPCLTAYQIEWNKMHAHLQRWSKGVSFQNVAINSDMWKELAVILTISEADLERLASIYQGQFASILDCIKSQELSISVRLLNGSFSQYMRATHEWFEAINDNMPDLAERPVYFVSSNTHSLANLVTGYAIREEKQLDGFINSIPESEIYSEWEKIKAGTSCSNKFNFLYYVLKKFQSTAEGDASWRKQLEAEQKSGVTRITSKKTFDVEAQLIELDKIDTGMIDPRLQGEMLGFLKDSRAVILNIDYPLGLAAYNLLSTISIHLTDICGVYTMGKSASLNAARGDVIMPNVVQDEHSHNTYLFHNSFSAADVSPYLNYGTILDNQKAICVLGTFLQNAHLMDVFYREGFADIEMELGNFCSAIFEATRPKRFPINEIVNLYNLPMDFGVLHYISDTPMQRGKNLGESTLSYYGMDSTYACSIAILRRIFALEKTRLAGSRKD